MRTIVEFPNKSLVTKTSDVSDMTTEISGLISDMKYIANQSHVLGIAANQLGESKSILVAERIVYINPKITDQSGNIEITEGCLSFPEVFVKVKRANRIKVFYLDEDFSEKTTDLEGLSSVVLQHEIDHLFGITFLDKLSPLKKELTLKKYMKNSNNKHR